MPTMNIGLAIIATLVIIYLLPFVAYGSFSALGWVDPPKGSPAAFLLSVLVSKSGTAIAFVLIFWVARHDLAGRWLLYAGMWWLMYVIGEVGQAIGPDYTWQEAVAGILSETVYFPAAAWVVHRLVLA